MKILITGGLGFIGSVTAQLFIDLGMDVIVADNHSDPSQHPRCPIHRVDTRSVQFLDLVRDYQPEAIIHFAAKHVVPESFEQPLEYFDNNVGGMINVLKACEAYNIKKFVFSSTSALYGEPAMKMVTETDMLKPICPYSKSKLMCEMLLQELNRKRPDFRYACLRYFNAAGATFRDGRWFGERRSVEHHVIPIFVKRHLNNLPLTVYGGNYSTPDGSAVRDFVHVEDLAMAHFMALKWLKEETHRADIFNIGTGDGYSVFDVANMVTKISNRAPIIQMGAPRKGDVGVLMNDPTKSEFELGWKASKTFTDIVQSTWDFQTSLLGEE